MKYKILFRTIKWAFKVYTVIFSYKVGLITERKSLKILQSLFIERNYLVSTMNKLNNVI